MKKGKTSFLKKYQHWQENKPFVFVLNTAKGILLGKENRCLPAQECEPSPCSSCVPCGSED